MPFVPGSPSLTSCSPDNPYHYANAPNSPAITPDIFDLAPNLPDLSLNLPTLSRKLPVHLPNPPVATTTPPGFTARASGLAPNLPEIIPSMPVITPCQSTLTSPPELLIPKIPALTTHPSCAPEDPPVFTQVARGITPNSPNKMHKGRKDYLPPFKAKRYLKKRL